jgi:hypothetical protein
MKNTFKFIGAVVFIATCVFMAQAPKAQAQATAQVYPRQYVLWNAVLTNNQYVTNNSALAPQLIGVFTNTLTPFTGPHPIGLSVILTSTNVGNTHSSNIVINAYRAFDLSGGNSNTLGGRYGTNFESSACFSWTIPWTTNETELTNIMPSTWEPATAIGFTISNGSSSNVVMAFTMSQAP